MNKSNEQYLYWKRHNSLFLKPLIQSIESVNLKHFQELNSDIFSDFEAKLRLGKKVERFFSFALKDHPRFKILAENLQIIENGITKGELDFIIEDLESAEVFHLEMVHKFYLHIPKEGQRAEDCLIGPNLKDSLNQKLRKLKKHQFPLIQDPFCMKTLRNRGLDAEMMSQKLLFTAEIFESKKQSMESDIINKNCVSGYWQSLQNFKNSHQKGDLYHLPIKSEWLTNPDLCMDWTDTEEFWSGLEKEIKNRYSPMVWKKSDSKISKLFVVWWD